MSERVKSGRMKLPKRGQRPPSPDDTVTSPKPGTTRTQLREALVRADQFGARIGTLPAIQKHIQLYLHSCQMLEDPNVSEEDKAEYATQAIQLSKSLGGLWSDAAELGITA